MISAAVAMAGCANQNTAATANAKRARMREVASWIRLGRACFHRSVGTVRPPAVSTLDHSPAHSRLYPLAFAIKLGTR